MLWLPCPTFLMYSTVSFLLRRFVSTGITESCSARACRRQMNVVVPCRSLATKALVAASPEGGEVIN